MNRFRARGFRPLLLTVGAMCLVISACSDDGDGLINTRRGVTIFATPTEGEAALTVEFVGRATEGLEVESFRWLFDDGSTSTEQDPTHTFEEPGTYEVKLLGFNASDGASWEATETITVTGSADDLASSEDSDDAQNDDDESSGDSSYEAWRAAINAACAATAAASEAVGGPADTPERRAAYLSIAQTESEAIAAAGVPTENTDQAQQWLALQSGFAANLTDLLANPPTLLDDPRYAETDAAAAALNEKSAELGLDDCTTP